MKKALIFDLDGTLLDSMAIWDTIGEEYLIRKGVKNIPFDLKETLKPMSLLDAAEYFITEFALNLSPQQISDEINAMIEDKYKYDIPLKKGVLPFLQNHRDHDMCIATATDKHLVEFALKRLGIDHYFRFIITSTEVGNSKQNPDIFIQAAERLHTKIEDCIVFEDALHAIKTAKSAGFFTIGVYEKNFEHEINLIKNYADQYVYHLCEVL